MSRTGYLVAAFRFILAISVPFLPGAVLGESEIDRLINDVRDGQSIYYSPEASAYFAGHGGYGSTTGMYDKDAALKTFKAVVRLAELGPSAQSAVAILIEKFPKGVHVSEILAARYNGEGTIDDWVSTYAMSEKNKFMLSSPFLDYNSMLQCEHYIDVAPKADIIEKPSGSQRQAVANVAVTLTLNAAACALTSITGQNLGADIGAWRQWWSTNRNYASVSTVSAPVTSQDTYSPSPAVSTTTYSGKSFADIIVGGQYRMSLTTGDELIGIVEGRTDTSVIIETTDGKPYVFRPSLVVRYELMKAPEKKRAGRNTGDDMEGEVTTMTYEELQQRRTPGLHLEIRLNNGSVFKGNLLSIDNEMINLDVEGSSIPISRDVIGRIASVPVSTKKKIVAPKKDAAPQGPPDTVIAKNSENDEWGNPKEDLVYSGKITADNTAGVTIMTGQGEKKIRRNMVKRVITHATSAFEEPIKKYAKPLFCSQDMILVDMPPAKAGRPFFKVCVDKYEYPNKEGTLPKTGVSFAEAQELCAKAGKRLCTSEEWRWACSGHEGYAYPYGWNMEKNRCNTDSNHPENSGNRINCISKFGAYDMSGNVFEWVTGEKSEPAMMGGPFSKCQTVSPGMDGSAKPMSGFRCCKSN